MIYKQSSETINSSIDFSPGLAAGETIVSISTVAVSPSGALAVGQQAVNNAATGVVIQTSGGIANNVYNVAITIVTSYNQTLTGNVGISVIQGDTAYNWTSVMPIILRGMIGDNGPTPQYSDTSLISLLSVSAVLVSREVTFLRTYIINVLNATITPDPTTVPSINGAPFDEDFIALSCLKAAQLIADGEYRNASKYAISHRNGPSHIDAKGVAENLKVMAATRLKTYENARLFFEVGNGSVGRAILAPYNAFISVYAGNVSTLNTGANRDDTASLFGGYG